MSHDPAGGVALDQLFPAAQRSGPAGVAIEGCTNDWRQVRPGDAFVATLENDADGHDYVTQAVKRGAAAVIVDRPVPVFSTPVYQVEDSRVAYGELCHALADNPSRRLRVIGVVGTQGKSTVIALLESIFSEAGCQVGVLSSLKSYDGMSCAAGVGEALAPSALASRLARMEAAGCTHALVELSSVALSQHKLAGIELDAVCGTVIDSARLDLHHTAQNYRDHLRRAFDYLSDSGLAVLNADDAVSCRWLSDLDAPSLTYGFGEQAQITADILDRNACETVFVLAAGCESAAVRTTIVGEHHVMNCLAAATVALASGVDLPTIAAGLENLQKLPARMERVDCGQDFAVYVDSADTPCSLRAALRTARQLSRGRVICVLGAGLPRTASEGAAVRSVVRKMADVVILTDPLNDGEHQRVVRRAASDQVSATAEHVVADRGAAIARAVAVAEPGDVVVIAGSNGPTECGFGASEMPEAELARELLYARELPTPLRLVG